MTECAHPSVTGGNCDACGKPVAVNGHVAGCHASGLEPGRSCSCGPVAFIAGLFAARAEAQQEQDALAEAIRERDELRAEAERLRRQRSRLSHMVAQLPTKDEQARTKALVEAAYAWLDCDEAIEFSDPASVDAWDRALMRLRDAIEAHRALKLSPAW